MYSSLTNHQNTNTYSLSTLRITEFTQAVITPVAHGEYGTNRARVCVRQRVCRIVFCFFFRVRSLFARGCFWVRSYEFWLVTKQGEDYRAIT